MNAAMPDARTYACPLCGLEFAGAACHAACPMSSGCAKVRCPRCGYEFVEDGRVARWLRRMFGGRPDAPSAIRGEDAREGRER
ncbi:MAG TPA: hypothetical protein VEZ11_10185 [Thermoanaerobaculia bacterium]|nr:hypothetical protein [Thermoanaerobaculia bacterium]